MRKRKAGSRTSIRIPEDLAKRVEAVAEKERRSANNVMELCLEGYLPVLEARAEEFVKMAARYAAQARLPKLPKE